MNPHRYQRCIDRLITGDLVELRRFYGGPVIVQVDKMQTMTFWAICEGKRRAFFISDIIRIFKGNSSK